MADPQDAVTNLLIAGTSHVGKSSLAAELSQALGWNVVSTDSLARHPGRPWPVAPPHVAEFYARMSDQSILQFLRHHHENMRPQLERALSDNRARATPCIWEGSALRPEYFGPTSQPGSGPAALMICLTAPASVLHQRIHATCGYPDLKADHRTLVDRFLTRSLAENDALCTAARAQDIDCLDTSDPKTFAAAKLRLINLLRQGQHPAF